MADRRDPRHVDREAELKRQEAVRRAVDKANAEHLAELERERAERGQTVLERSASWRTTEAYAGLREVQGDPRTIEGIAVPYGQVALATENGAEAFAPAAFRGSIDHWMSRTDGARMAFRPAHGSPPVGTVSALQDTPEGVRFRAAIFETPGGDEYLAQVRAGLNGVSAEFSPGAAGPSRRGRDGTVIHREARLHAIAGSVSPAYDGARISLRDMEVPVNCPHCSAALEPGVAHTCPGVTAAVAAASAPAAPVNRDAAPAVAAIPIAERSALEQGTIRAIRPSLQITRPEAVYSRSAEHSFLFDNWRATQGDAEAAGRQQRHYGQLAEMAVAMEREAAWRFLAPDVHERAGDVLSSEIPGAYPNDYVPGLLTPRILKGRPMGGFYNRVPIADARPRIFPKVTTSTSVAVQSAEGAALTATDLATTSVTATPLMYGAFTDVSRQTLDGGDPSAEAMILQDLFEAYAQASETVIKTAVEAGASAGTAITAATPYAGAIGAVVNYYATRFKPASGAFIPPAQFTTILGQLDTTGRPLVPQLGVVNADGSVGVNGQEIAVGILSAQGKLSYASTLNTWVIGIPSDYVIFESAVARFSYDQVVGPQAVRIGIWSYLVVGTRLGSLKTVAA